ncbi:steroid dehydrogenase, putative [Schistosoma mansoni]|uniref:steroid dehydrogenase, putative n=1 Tax=Schistosoma mansoni TaxID=6183 RepID=UPI00022C86CD|nr:steroid dehydrogenase, putative [Schistosoma mansoni]|eukprot:XP_018645474.1 steroid dehydrogenase, putative [Schistosoma mansoni]
MLISNDEEQLSCVANRIATTYNVQTRIVVADFTKVILILNLSVNHVILKSLSLNQVISLTCHLVVFRKIYRRCG